MLLDFKVSNFKSFVEEADFSMMAAPKQKGLDYSLTELKEGRRKRKVLCSSVIYGPNAAGKSNIIEAMDVLRTVVIRGNIKNVPSKDMIDPANPASSTLELIPNCSIDDARPINFYIEFYEAGMRFTYELAADVGQFLEADYSRRIQRESLMINNELVFLRENDLQVSFPASIRSYIQNGSLDDPKTLQIAQNSLNDEELFLTNGFKLIYAAELVRIITGWFIDKIAIICRADSLRVVQDFGNSSEPSAYIVASVNKAAEEFGCDSNDIAYLVKKEGDTPQLCSILHRPGQNRNLIIRADVFESYGTIRFVNLFPLIVRAITVGGTLVIDEFDASIHPMALMSIVNVFHNDEVNVHHAQLIFNTHNPIFLNSNIFRRDEIKFVERDDERHYSSLYTLADFGTSGHGGVRKNEDYMKNYFVSRYGAIKDIDFTSILEEIMKKEQNQNNGDKKTNE